MSFNILQEIREIFHGLGERKPRIDTVTEIQSVLLKQMTLLIYQAHVAAADTKCKYLITPEHVLYVLRNHKLTIVRILRYYWLKNSFHKMTQLSATAAITVDTPEKMSKNEHMNDDYVDSILNSNQSSLDPELFLKELNFKNQSNISSDISSDSKKKSMFNKIRKAISELNLDWEFTLEDIDHAVKERQIRVNLLSIVISPSAYQDFELCRSQNFQNRIGLYLLDEVRKALPLSVNYNNEAKELFLFLAKETIACLFDRVCENRKLKEPILTYNTQNTNLNKKHCVITLVDEIEAVTNAVWNSALEDICVPFHIDNKFFANQLIFD